jgi:cobalt-zinc-cadmium efflux system outer membrane protein
LRQTAQGVISAQGELLNKEAQQVRLDLINQTKVAFHIVLFEQNRMALRKEQLSLSLEVADTVHRRVLAGKDPGIEEDKARLQLAFEELALDQTQADYEMAWRHLSGLWGEPESRPTKVSGNFFQLNALPESAELLNLLNARPDVDWWQAKSSELSAIIQRERANGKPVPEFEAGVKHGRGAGNSSVRVGLSWPLLWRDKNRDSIRAAELRMEASAYGRESFLRQKKSELQASIDSYFSHLKTVTRLQEYILPAAEATYDAFHEGYLQGKFSLLEVLDAQRALFEVHEQLLEARFSLHEEWLAISALTGFDTKENN